MQTIEASRDFTSIGQLSADLQVTVQRIERIATKIGLSPSLRLNRIAYFSAEQCERLTDEFRSAREQSQ